MNLLLDPGLPRTSVSHFQQAGVAAEHVADIGLFQADDETILRHARDHAQIVVTLDADFHRQLALSTAVGPSVIRIRIEGLKSRELAQLVLRVVDRHRDDLKSGAMLTITESAVRLRRLPLVRG